MQGKKENVNLHTETEEKGKNILPRYCQRKIKNFMYTSSIFSITYTGYALVQKDFPIAIIGISCCLGFYSTGKLIGSKIPKIKLYSGSNDDIPVIIHNQLYELEEEKKCYTLSKHHD